MLKETLNDSENLFFIRRGGGEAIKNSFKNKNKGDFIIYQIYLNVKLNN